ncbi:MAG: Ig-like domain-containing protein, partial [Clostridia bacterium]|nr:Ig-like domain-containing protein [Clostridia bacterium]
MKIMRMLMIGLCIALLTLGITGCFQPTGYLQSITLKNEQLIVGLYMSDTIEYQGEGDATYSSDNPDIVSVDENGKVTGLKVGKASITVAIGEAKAVCEVTVVDTNESPYIKFAISDNEYNLLVDDYIQLNGKLIFSQEERAEKITYESSSDCVVVDENGKVTAKKIGTATITASVNFFDKVITKLVTINVLKYPVALNTTTSNYEVYTTSAKGNNDSITLPNSVIVDGQIKTVDFTYEYDDSKLTNEGNVFKVKLPCAKDETVKVKMSHTTPEQERYAFTIEIKIRLVNEDLQGKTTLILENGGSQA